MGGCSCVISLAVTIKATNITHTDTMAVMTDAVGTSTVDRTPLFNKAVKAYDIMISDISPAFFIYVISLYFFGTYINTRLRRTAMDDNLVYYSHLCSCFQSCLTCNLCR